MSWQDQFRHAGGQWGERLRRDFDASLASATEHDDERAIREREARQILHHGWAPRPDLAVETSAGTFTPEIGVVGAMLRGETDRDTYRVTFGSQEGGTGLQAIRDTWGYLVFAGRVTAGAPLPADSPLRTNAGPTVPSWPELGGAFDLTPFVAEGRAGVIIERNGTASILQLIAEPDGVYVYSAADPGHDDLGERVYKTPSR